MIVNKYKYISFNYAFYSPFLIKDSSFVCRFFRFLSLWVINQNHQKRTTTKRASSRNKAKFILGH